MLAAEVARLKAVGGILADPSDPAEHPADVVWSPSPHSAEPPVALGPLVSRSADRPEHWLHGAV